jgi:hypothetical protein
MYLDKRGSSSSPKSNDLVEIFHGQAIHISILLSYFLSQAACDSESNGSLLTSACCFKQAALEEGCAGNLALVCTWVNRPDVQCPIGHGAKRVLEKTPPMLLK